MDFYTNSESVCIDSPDFFLHRLFLHTGASVDIILKTFSYSSDHTDELYFQFSCGDLISFLYVYVDRLIKEWELHLLNLRRVRIMHRF